MPDTVTLRRQRRIAVITVDNPPVNALSPGVPEGIRAHLAAAIADPEVDAVVLTGAGRGFIAGADIKQLGDYRPLEVLRLPELIEAADKPVVAAIQGFALGGGLEYALGCHYRIATPDARIGLPEVTIGVLPGAGGTQRLPRLVGPGAALDMIVTGRHLSATEGKAKGVIDEIVDGPDLVGAAVAFAERVAERRPLPRCSRNDERLTEDRPHEALFVAMREKVARRARNQLAPYACMDAVQAALELPFAEGLELEHDILERLVNGDEAVALRYAFLAERRARVIPGLDQAARPRPIERAAVVGGGTMGTGIAMTLADAGVPVRLLEVSAEALARSLERIHATYQTSLKRGSVTAEAVAERLALIQGVSEYDAIAGDDIVIEAVFEDMAVKQAVFATLDATMKQGAVLATNTSALDVDAIAAATGRPQAVVGTHFFSPANVMKLLEIVRGAATAPDVLASVMGLARRLGKVGVVTGNCDGFTANRSRLPFSVEMNILIEEGASPAQIDRVMVEFGYPMGPFAVADLAGGDIGYAGRKRREAADPTTRRLPIADRLVESGRHGQKTGAGWYRYETGDRRPREDLETARIIDEVRGELGVNLRSFSDEEVLRRILLASVNEACKILEERIAARPGDVDAMWLNGFGFPRYRGGLMHWADGIGVATVHQQIAAWEAELGPRWKPSALLGELARSGRSFSDL